MEMVDLCCESEHLSQHGSSSVRERSLNLISLIKNDRPLYKARALIACMCAGML